jgi:hypothetical protein
MLVHRGAESRNCRIAGRDPLAEIGGEDQGVPANALQSAEEAHATSRGGSDHAHHPCR